MTKVFTCVADGDRRYQMCRCADCKLEARCTPGFDFWEGKTVTGDALLRCETCWGRQLALYKKKTGTATTRITKEQLQ